MEIVLVLIVLAVIAAAAFMYMRSRGGAHDLTGRGQGPALRGPRRTRAAAHHDPMAEAVERHAMATDPHEAAEAELRLQAQANRVASDLHAQQASTLESSAGGRGLAGRSASPADAYGAPAAYDEAGRPVHHDGAYQPGAPAYQDQEVFQTRDGKTIDAHGRPVHVDGEPGYENGPPPAGYQDGTPVADDDRAAYYDEQGRPVYPEDRPRY
ncbi:MAG TPA: hypothetical protein VGV90_18965 [Solirubrobacteraceae bacterium]|nr:hypothetical protein [Solirubrobacteraceae bacterium]